jgi:hypothetical protein
MFISIVIQGVTHRQALTNFFQDKRHFMKDTFFRTADYNRNAELIQEVKI